MTPTAAQLRREKLKARQTAAIKGRNQKGSAKKSILDWSKYSGTKPENFTIKIKENHLFDILPFKVTQEWYKNLRTKQGNPSGLDVGEWDYKLELPLHKNVGEDNEIFICLREAFGKKCPICEDMFEEYAREKPDKEKARSLNCSWRDYFNIFDYNAEENPDDLRIWEDASYALFEKEFLEEAEEGEEIILYTDTEEGRSIEFKTKEDSIGSNKFPIINLKTLEFKERDPYDDSIVDETISFDALIHIPTYDEVLAAHRGLKEEETDPKKEKREEKVKEEPKPRGRQRTSKKETKPEPEKEIDNDNPCPCGKKFGYDCDPEPNELERDEQNIEKESAPTRRRSRKPANEPETKKEETGTVTRRRRR